MMHGQTQIKDTIPIVPILFLEGLLVVRNLLNFRLVLLEFWMNSRRIFNQFERVIEKRSVFILKRIELRYEKHLDW